jgi:putative ABC transport system permease protein
MIRNYLRLVIRQLLNEKIHTFIIVVGLAIGIASALIIAQYVEFELSFDKSVRDRENIYYTYLSWVRPENVVDGRAFPAIAPFAKTNISEVKECVRATVGDETPVHLRLEENGQVIKSVAATNFYFVDYNFLDFFSMPLVAGDANALREPYSMVLTKTLAGKLFGGNNPLNEIISFIAPGRPKVEFIVKGVVADPLSNSSVQFNALMSLSTVGSEWKTMDESWFGGDFQTYIKLHPGSNYKVVEEKLNKLSAASIDPTEHQLDLKIDIKLTPFNEYHFFRHHNTTTTQQIHFTGDKRLLIYFSILGALIILISWANYINLSTAKAISRAKEVGLRKVSGATRGNLVVQFFLEFLFLNIISLVLALTFTQLLFGLFANIIGSRAEWVFWTRPMFWLLVIGITLVSTIVSGIYPALVISGYKPARVLAGNFARSSGGMALRKTLVIFQFALSVFMVASIYVISRQLYFMQDKELGLTAQQVIVIPTQELDPSMKQLDVFQTLRLKLKGDDHFVSTSAGGTFPGANIPRNMIWSSDKDPTRKSLAFDMNIVRQDYFKTMGIPLIAGREFRADPLIDTAYAIINERGAVLLGFNDPSKAIGEKIVSGDTKKAFEIIGVVKDFSANLKVKNGAEIFLSRDMFTGNALWGYMNMFVRVSNKDIKTSVDVLEARWAEIFGDMPKDYFFLDKYFDTFYKQERQFAGVFGYFAMIGIAVTCMGLFGLSVYETNSRRKEIGIRKTVGASAFRILWMFSENYLKLVLISVLITIPFAYSILREWLNNYPDHIVLQWDALVVPALIMCFLAIGTVGYHTLKAASTNPVNSLRNY